MSKRPGYTGHVRLRSVSLVQANFEQVLFRTDQDEGRIELPPELEFPFNVGLRYRDLGEGPILVELRVTVESSEELVQPYEVEVTYRGEFELRELPEGLSRKQVAERNAAMILFPYVRETISSLTARGIAGPLVLPPVNVVAMLEQGSKENRPGVPA